MPTVYTIGYQKKPLSIFINQLRDVEVDAVIDVRLRNTSHLAGYTKKDTLEFLLTEGFGIAYEHHPELAPTDELFDTYRCGNLTWPLYEAAIGALLKSRRAEGLARDLYNRHNRPCLLCSEPTADQCHRSIITAYWSEHIPNLTVAHL